MQEEDNGNYLTREIVSHGYQDGHMLIREINTHLKSIQLWQCSREKFQLATCTATVQLSTQSSLRTIRWLQTKKHEDLLKEELT